MAHDSEGNVIDWTAWPVYQIEDRVLEYPPEIGMAVLVEVLEHMIRAIRLTNSRSPLPEPPLSPTTPEDSRPTLRETVDAIRAKMTPEQLQAIGDMAATPPEA